MDSESYWFIHFFFFSFFFFKSPGVVRKWNAQNRIGWDMTGKQRAGTTQGIQCHSKWLRTDLLRASLWKFAHRCVVSRDLIEKDLETRYKIKRWIRTHIHTHTDTHDQKYTHSLREISRLTGSRIWVNVTVLNGVKVNDSIFLLSLKLQV